MIPEIKNLLGLASASDKMLLADKAMAAGSFSLPGSALIAKVGAMVNSLFQSVIGTFSAAPGVTSTGVGAATSAGTLAVIQQVGATTIKTTVVKPLVVISNTAIPLLTSKLGVGAATLTATAVAVDTVPDIQGRFNQAQSIATDFLINPPDPDLALNPAYRNRRPEAATEAGRRRLNAMYNNPANEALYNPLWKPENHLALAKHHPSFNDALPLSGEELPTALEPLIVYDQDGVPYVYDTTGIEELRSADGTNEDFGLSPYIGDGQDPAMLQTIEEAVPVYLSWGAPTDRELKKIQQEKLEEEQALPPLLFAERQMLRRVIAEEAEERSRDQYALRAMREGNTALLQSIDTLHNDPLPGSLVEGQNQVLVSHQGGGYLSPVPELVGDTYFSPQIVTLPDHGCETIQVPDNFVTSATVLVMHDPDDGLIYEEQFFNNPFIRTEEKCLLSQEVANQYINSIINQNFAGSPRSFLTHLSNEWVRKEFTNIVLANNFRRPDDAGQIDKNAGKIERKRLIDYANEIQRRINVIKRQIFTQNSYQRTLVAQRISESIFYGDYNLYDFKNRYGFDLVKPLPRTTTYRGVNTASLTKRNISDPNRLSPSIPTYQRSSRAPIDWSPFNRAPEPKKQPKNDRPISSGNWRTLLGRFG